MSSWEAAVRNSEEVAAAVAVGIQGAGHWIGKVVGRILRMVVVVRQSLLAVALRSL